MDRLLRCLLSREVTVDVEAIVEGNVGTLTYAFMNTSGILDEWAELGLARGTQIVREYLETKPDYLGRGGAGTLASQIALMGNLHTTEVLLHGTPQEVVGPAREAILAAKDGGGFILITGDQCPRETPEESLFALHRAVEEVGVYE